MQCTYCKNETDNAPEPCVYVGKIDLGTQVTRSGNTETRTTTYKHEINAAKPIEIICTCDNCFLKEMNKKIADKTFNLKFGIICLIIGLLITPLFFWINNERINGASWYILDGGGNFFLVITAFFGFCPLFMGLGAFSVTKRLKFLKNQSDSEKIERSKNENKIADHKDIFKKYFNDSTYSEEWFIPVNIAKNLPEEQLLRMYDVDKKLAASIIQIAK